MSSSRLESVVLVLRDLILSGEMTPGSKVTEVGMAERLGVSRTPIRLALQVLESEGLVTSEPNRGFTVKGITLRDVLSGFDVRGALEGLASRLVAEAGLRRADEAALRRCVERGDDICANLLADGSALRAWAEVNREFHAIIIEAAESAPLTAAHELICRNPFVGPTALAFSSNYPQEDADTIVSSQRHHREIWEAMREGQGARAEFLAREHVFQARKNNARRLEAQGARGENEKNVVNLKHDA